MQCHYEVLGVARDAGDDEIKKSYRKLALQWHPDKNPDRVDECTKFFLKLQQAYEVLSDPQERAWYDKHREAILRGGLGHGDEYKDSCLDVYQYFNSSCYSGFDDSETGFYSVYSEVFKKISSEDKEFVELDEGEEYEVPEFGSSNSSYDEVVGRFYAYWESYCTARSYVWAEKYDTREAPNRQIRRLMEQDNKKLREKARKERNEEVRIPDSRIGRVNRGSLEYEAINESSRQKLKAVALVGFVRKRDKRVQAYKKRLEERAVEIARLAEEKKKRDREKRKAQRQNYKESEWSSMSTLEQQLKALESDVTAQFGNDDDDDYTDDDDDVSDNNDDNGECEAQDEVADSGPVVFQPVVDLYCVACNKQFKSEKALENHCQSKKHIENVDLIKAKMEADQALLEGEEPGDLLDGDGEELESLNQLSDEDSNDLIDSAQQSKSKRSKKQKKKQKQFDRLIKKQTVDNHHDDDVHDDNTSSSHTTDKASLRLRDTNLGESVQNGTTEQNETVIGSTSENIIADSTTSTAAELSAAIADVNNGESAASAAWVNNDESLAAAAAAKPESAQVSPSAECDKKSKGQKSKGSQEKSLKCNESGATGSEVFRCNKCRQTFTTRNKLFDHIKVSGHALRIEERVEPNNAPPTGGKKKEKGKKSKR